MLGRFGISLLFVLLVHCASGQKTTVYTTEYRDYRDAMDLFDKEKYTAAQEKFQLVIERFTDVENELVMHSKYYNAICALELYHKDAEFLLKEFAREYPESPRIQTINFELGGLYYRNKRWLLAVEWYERVDKFKLTKEELAEYYFKKGYSHFREEEYTEASADFKEIKDVESQYSDPATYYYSHIAYHEKNYQTALEGFEKLKTKEGFSKIVPYYITQILFLQKKYDEVIHYGVPLLDSMTPQKKDEISNLVGDAYYRLGKFDEAVPYLIGHANANNTTLEEKYRLGYALYRSEEYQRATGQLERVSRVENALGQNALYYLGACYVKLGEKSYARNAYQEASKLDFDKEIQEDALFRYAQLAYELSFNPYDEAILAFQTYLANYPDSPKADDAYQYLINVYTTTKNYKAALESLDKVAKSDFRLQSAYQMVVYNRSVELYSNLQYGKAIDHFKKVKTYPIDKELNSMSMYWIGEAYYQLDDWAAARTWYKKFLEEPGSYGSDFFGVAHYNIAYTYLKDEEFDRAIEEFRQYATRPDKDELRLNDAYLRIGDGYFQRKEDERAIEFYQKSLAMNVKQMDYAHYQIGMAHGYLRNYDDKIAELKKILTDQSGSSFVVSAKYQIAEAYRVQEGKGRDAIKYYEQVVEQYPDNLLVKPSLLSLGYLYYKEGDYSRSLDAYTRVLHEEPSKEDCKAALLGLKDVYVKKGQPEKWEKLAKQHGCVDPVQFNLDSTYFAEHVQNFWDDGNCEKLKTGVDEYVKKYPSGSYLSDAYFYKAECLYFNTYEDEALFYYEKVLTLPNNKRTEIALLRTAEMYYKADRFQDAFANYSNLEKRATNAENKLISYIGQMRCLYKLGDYTYAKDYAQLVIKSDDAPEPVKVQGQLIRGMSFFYLKEYDKALIELNRCNEMTTSKLGAEAKYHVCLIYFLREERKEVENQVLELIKQKPSYDYWVAKAYILLAENFALQENYFQARHTLQSIIDNYTNTDDDILTLARQKLEWVTQLEENEDNNGSGNGDNRSMEIDLGGDEDKIKGDEDGDGGEPETNTPEDDKEEDE